MGQHQEITAKEMGSTRAEQDRIAFRSHQNAAKAQSAGYMAEEIEPFSGVDKDNLVRADTSLEKLAKLKPVFDRSDKGTLTAGNSSSLTDGASAVCLMSEEEAKAQGREVLAFIEAVEYAAIDPNAGLLMAPGTALPRLMQKNKLTIADVDFFEIHEAFASQVDCNQMIWAKSIGRVPDEKMNVNGGSVAIGHPFAATGGRLLLSLANQLKRSGKRTGVISVCAAGAMAAAVLLKR